MPDVQTDPRSLRRAYLEEFRRFRHEVQHGCRGYQLDYHLLRTDEPLDVALTTFLASRMARVK
jgi:hypothetical protein